MFKGEYIKGKRWNGKGYDILNNNTYELKEGNGTGKEYDYDNGALIFEGEYKNWGINGKGKEYYYFNNNLLFEGEYINGKKWNGKGYDGWNNNIIYELKNCIGIIKDFYDNGNLEFEAVYLNGEENGEGKLYYDNRKEYYINDNLKFEGKWKVRI